VKAIAQFEGVARRFTVRGEVGGSPSSRFRSPSRRGQGHRLNGGAQLVPGRRIIAGSPHRYTRTRDQLTEFPARFHDCRQGRDVHIAAAGEKADRRRDERGPGQARARGRHKDITYVAKREDLAAVARSAGETRRSRDHARRGQHRAHVHEVIALLEKRLGAARRRTSWHRRIERDVAR